MKNTERTHAQILADLRARSPQARAKAALPNKGDKVQAYMVRRGASLGLIAVNPGGRKARNAGEGQK